MMMTMAGNATKKKKKFYGRTEVPTYQVGSVGRAFFFFLKAKKTQKTKDFFFKK